MEKLPLLFDLAGTFVFALSGAMAGVKRKLDLFGVLVLSFAAANSGGIARDVLIGAVPPNAISDWRYLGISLAAGLLTFYFSNVIIRLWNPVLLFDAAGLALFAVSGAQKALNYGLNPVMATSLGMLTGIGGGMMRDVLLTEISCRFTLRTLRGCRAGGSVRGGRRSFAGAADNTRGDSRHGSLLRSSCAGDPVRLAIADRESLEFNKPCTVVLRERKIAQRSYRYSVTKRPNLTTREQEQSLSEQCRRAARRLANADLLLEAVSQLDQTPLTPGLSQNIHSDRYAQRGCRGRRREACWYGDGRKAGNRSQNTVAVGLIGFGQRHHQPLLQRIDQGIEFVFGENRSQCLTCALVSNQPFPVVRLLQAVREAFRAGQEFLQRRLVKLARRDDLGK